MSQNGQLIHYSDFPSQYVDKRNVDVWLPPSYRHQTTNTYPVIYMHDGQNLFEDTLSGFGVEWGVDETIIRLSKEGIIPECIVVGIWNTSRRYPEYQPQKPYEQLDPDYRAAVTELYGGAPVSDNYLKFLVTELKPAIDGEYRTKPQKEYTFIMGSSMGGLVSLYGICEYPEVFAGAGCLSTHWVTRVDLENGEMARVMKDYLKKNLPAASNHKIYFDYGTKGLDFYYDIHQQGVDTILLEKGYTEENWETRKFEGADHNEHYWQSRLYVPLTFLLSDLANQP